MFNPNIQATSTAINNLCFPSMGELFGYTPKKIQIFQNKVLRIIKNAPYIIWNENIHKDLQIVKIKDLIHTLSKKSIVHYSTQQAHFTPISIFIHHSNDV